jgi:hypothetical protein
MTDDDREEFDDAMENVNIIDKIDILISLIETSKTDRYKSLQLVLEEAKFQLAHAWNEVQYYMELCESYETAIKKAGSELLKK